MNPTEVFQATNSIGDSSFFEKDSNSSILEAEKNIIPTRKYRMKPEVFWAASTGNSSFFKGVKILRSRLRAAMSQVADAETE